MRGGLINKAQRGALAVTLPIGFRRTAKGGVMFDPDEAVRLAIATVFERFGVLRNARAVQRHFLTNGLKLPRLIQSGPEAGQIVWMRPSYQPVDEVVIPSRRWSQPVVKTIRAGPALFSTKTSRMAA